MKFLQVPPAAGSSAAWEMRCKVAPVSRTGSLDTLPIWATGTKPAGEAQ